MAKIIPIPEHYQHFLAERKESFWGDVYGETKLAWKRLLEQESRRERDRYAVREACARRRSRRQPYRNGYYERDFVTRLGTIRLRVAQTAHHQRDRALLRGSSAPNSSHGVLCECRKRGPNHVLHLPEIQPGVENPYPLPIYTSSLTTQIGRA